MSCLSCLRRPTLATTDMWAHVHNIFYGRRSKLSSTAWRAVLPPHLGRDTQWEWARSYKVAETGNNGWSVTFSALSSLSTSSDLTNSLYMRYCRAGSEETYSGCIQLGYMKLYIIYIYVCFYMSVTLKSGSIVSNHKSMYHTYIHSPLLTRSAPSCEAHALHVRMH